jgi:hypothetical protein
MSTIVPWPVIPRLSQQAIDDAFERSVVAEFRRQFPVAERVVKFADQIEREVGKEQASKLLIQAGYRLQHTE